MFSEPAIGNKFFGREDILGVLEKRVNALLGGYRQNVALTGHMLSGKSSVIYQFIFNLKDPSLIPIYIEVIEEPFGSFVDKYIATLLYNFLTSIGQKPEKDLSFLIEKAEPMIPHTVFSIKKIKANVSKRNNTDAYRKLLQLTSIFKKETQKSCIVILDEFHNLDNFKIKNPYLHFGKIIMIQKDTMYIVSSSQKNTIKKILSEKLALLYGNFEIVEVSGFDNKTSEDFLKEKLSGIEIPENFIGYLIDFTNKTPFYLDSIAARLREIAVRENSKCITGDIIVDAFTSLLHNTNGTIHQYFTNNITSLLEKKPRPGYMDILIAIACGNNKLRNVSKLKLYRLIELDMICKNGTFYYIQDSVFKFWLRTVYFKKKTTLVDDVTDKTGDFEKEVTQDMLAYMDESKKSASERVRELFELFNGENIEIKKKRLKLPRFVRVEKHRYGSCDELIGYQQKSKNWVCQIREGRIEEGDVSDLIERYYPMRNGISKKICIALNGIDTNALLLAKEKNVWIWDLKSINGLFRLYKRHNLIYK